MTTAHRPTWTAAVGTSNTRGNWATGGFSQQFSAKDQTSQMKMKFRQVGQGSEKELRQRDLKSALMEGESRAQDEKRSGKAAVAAKDKAGATPLLIKSQAEEELLVKAKKFDDADDEDSESDLSDSDEGDSDDDEEELQQELERIRKEREEVRLQKEADEAAIAARAAQEAAMTGNILMDPTAVANSSSQVKRRWNDDVVFKGQARTEPELKKRFINDTIRSDFHRSFLKKYVR